MKKSLQFVLIILIFFASFLFIKPLFDLFKGEAYVVATEDIVDAVFFGIVVPSVMLLSKRVKNYYVFVLLAIVIFVAAAFTKRTVLPWCGM